MVIHKDHDDHVGDDEKDCCKVFNKWQQILQEIIVKIYIYLFGTAVMMMMMMMMMMVIMRTRVDQNFTLKHG